MSLYPFLYLWLVLDAVILVLFAYRAKLSRGEERVVNLSHGTSNSQVVLAQKLTQIEKMSRILAIIAVVYGVALGVAAIVQAFTSPGTPGM